MGENKAFSDERVEKRPRGLSRDALKMIAMVTMTLNHFAHLFLSSGSLLYFTLVNVGYFTAPLMCLFVADAYAYTRSVKKYACRLLIFALISQLPFMLLEGNGKLIFQNLNMMFTLLIALLITAAWYEISENSFKYVVIALLIGVSYFTDWPLLGPSFTVIYLVLKGEKQGKIKTAAAMTAVFFLFQLFWSYRICLSLGLGIYLFHVLLGTMAVAAAGFSFACLYNGGRAEKGRVFFKWFFYLYYPVHLLILVLIKVLSA